MRQHGANMISLSAAVDSLMAMEGNVKRQGYLQTLIHAKWAWKELLRNTVYSITTHVVEVEFGRVNLPKGIGEVISLQMVDCNNNIQHLAFNGKINTFDLSKASSAYCSCKCKGDRTLCGMVDSIVYRTEAIEVNGEQMQKRIYNRVDPCGVLFEVTEVPIYNMESGEVEWRSFENRVCDIEVNEDGCTRDTPENIAMLNKHCGCYILDGSPWRRGNEAPHGRVPGGHSPYGEWTFEHGDTNVIHLRNAQAKRLLVTCFSDGECEGELMLPEFAQDALHMAILYSRAKYAPSNVVGLGAVRERKAAYNAARGQLLRYLYPINLEAFAAISGIIPKWG